MSSLEPPFTVEPSMIVAAVTANIEKKEMKVMEEKDRFIKKRKRVFIKSSVTTDKH